MWRSVKWLTIRFLLLALQLWAASLDSDRFFGPNKSHGTSVATQGRPSSESSLGSTSNSRGARDLVESWCSAYAQSDPVRLAGLEMMEVEIVDRFGDWHHLNGLRGRERFWREGFDMIPTEEFHPTCAIEHVRAIRSDLAIAQAKVSYDQGITLKGNERIPPFSEIHTFVLMKNGHAWLISAQDIIRQTLLSER